MSDKFDAVVIGAGQAGPSLAARLAKEGAKTAIIERKLIGGTCVNVGCIPTKTLVASARVAEVARRSEDFGIAVEGPVSVDMKRVKARKDAVVRKSRDGLTNWLKSTDNLTVYQGHARLEGANTLSVNGEFLEADRIFLNVGARAIIPEMPGLDTVDFLTNSSMMDIDFLPEHLVIVGGSYIGLEFAQMYRRFGSRVTVIERSDRLIGREDDDVSAAILDILEDDGIAVRLQAECVALEPHGQNASGKQSASCKQGVSVKLDCAGGPPAVAGSHLLLAVGRRPNTRDLGLETAGVNTDDRGFITVDDQLRTNVPHIWAIGECNGRGAFTHTAYNDYEIVVANLFDDDPRKVSDRIPCYGLFIDPPLGRVGMTLRQARETGYDVLIGEMPMARVARAVERGETQGFMRVVVDGKTKKILGASILGIGGDEIVHSLIDIMHADAPYTVIERAVHIHPTVSELIPTMLGELRPME